MLIHLGAAAPAQTVITSPGPTQVGVTVYRAPNRPAAQPLNLQWLNGFALITETRTIAIPAGDSDIRFEGVAGGIFPETAIVTDLPAGVIEKNQDTYLLSPGSLVDASLGSRVHLRRTSRATGVVRELEAIVRSSAEGGVVLQTEAGFEALRCTGLAETIRYDRVPPGLSARPSLSVKLRSQQATGATVTLSYLASGFDWQADYVATLSTDGARMDLFAWLTLANGDETGFRNADTNAVAGRLNRDPRPAPRARAEPLRLACWPSGTTSDIPETEFSLDRAEGIVVTGSRMMAPPPPPPPPPPASPGPGLEMMAQQEELGDIKLYRIPEPVTVASKSQKQIALLRRTGVKVTTVYRTRIDYPHDGTIPARRVLLTRNVEEQGLGLPLPAGRIVLFGRSAKRPILLGRGSVSDRAIGEDVDFEVGSASAVQVQSRILSSDGNGGGEYELEVTNAKPVAIPYEAEINLGALKWSSATAVGRRNGRPLWRATIPANGSATLRYRLSPPR